MALMDSNRLLRKMLRLLLVAMMSSLFVAACSIERAPSNKSRILQLSAEANYVAVSNELAEMVWSSDSDPELLMEYCAARFVVKPQSASCALARGASDEPTALAEVLWNIWTGRTQVAGAILNRLLEGKESRLWGAVGTLEFAHYSERHKVLAELLRKYNSDPLQSNPRFVPIFRRYQVAYLESVSDWTRLEELLQKFSQQEVMEDPELFSALARLRYVRGQASELKALLDAAAVNLGKTTVYQQRKADFLVLEKGIPASKSEIDNFTKSYPNNPELLMQSSYSALLNSSPDISQAAWKALLETARASQRNVRLLLDMATTLASYHKPVESSQIVRLIDRDGTDLDDFTISHVLWGWVHVFEGNIPGAMKELEVALTMAPNHVPANWLRVLIARQNGDPQKALEALKVLLAADPYNNNYRNLAKYFAETFESSELKALYRRLSPLAIPKTTEMKQWGQSQYRDTSVE